MGNYDIVVENANGCQQTYPISLEQTTPVVLNPISPIQICYEGDATLLATATGGTAPYHLVWEATDTTSSYVVNSAVAMSTTCITYDLNGCVHLLK
jgi:hypothetical protein